MAAVVIIKLEDTESRHGHIATLVRRAFAEVCTAGYIAINVHIVGRLHNDLHWLDVPQRVTFKLCTTVYKCLHGLAPKYLADLCVPVTEVAGRRQLRSASRGLLDLIPRFNMSNYGRRAFSFAGPHTWNSLPDQLRTSVSLATFKRSLKTFLFEQITHLAH